MQQSQPQSKTNQGTPSVTAPTTTALQYATAKVPVLLLTVCVHVFNPANPAMSLDVRQIFDSGIQRSYITNKVKSKKVALIRLLMCQDHIDQVFWV